MCITYSNSQVGTAYHFSVIRIVSCRHSEPVLASRHPQKLLISVSLAHALGALEKLNFKPDDVVVLTVSGRGDKDIETYLTFSVE